MDPLFNPPFFNDLPFRERPFVKRLAHFAKKHKEEGIHRAAYNHVLSHLEYGGCLADFSGLNARYNRIRALEDVDELAHLEADQSHQGQHQADKARVRFVNYYTVSTGIPKRPRSASPRLEPTLEPPVEPTLRLEDNVELRPGTPRISIEDCSDEGEREKSENLSVDDLTPLEPEPLGHDRSPTPDIPPEDLDKEPGLPPLAAIPEKPQLPDLNSITDKEERKQAEREAKRTQKAYEQAVKDREKAVRERQKFVEKQRKKAEKEAARLEKEEQKRVAKEQFRQQPQEQEAVKPAAPNEILPEKPLKERKFCTLPRKVNGSPDPTWVKVFMAGVDEVGAHCGLFLPGDHYEKLVGDVGGRIVEWVQEDLTRRAILDMS
jgi:hypothetical protein